MLCFRLLGDCFCGRSYAHLGAEEPDDGWMEEDMMRELEETRQLWLTIQQDPSHIKTLAPLELQQIIEYSQRNMDHQRVQFDKLKEQTRELEQAISSNELLIQQDEEGSELIQPLQAAVAGLKLKLEQKQALLKKEKSKLDPLAKLTLLLKTEFASRPREERVIPP